MRRLSIRWRLTLWYGAVLAGVLAVFGTSVFLLLKRELQNRASRALLIQMSVIEDELNRVQNRKHMEQRLEQLIVWHADVDIQVSSADGTLRILSDGIHDRGLPPPGIAPTTEQDVFDNFSVPGDGQFRMLSRLTTGAGLPVLVQVATSLDENGRQLGELLAIMLAAGSLAVACTLGGGYLLARQALAPVDRMAASADEITASQLDRRLHTPNPDDELGRLARTLNGMIGRLERSFEEIRRFTADAAHELRTPLAILRNEAEVALRVSRDSEQYRECLEDMLEEIEHLSRLSEDLLLLFREDAGLGAEAKELVRLDQLVCEIADHLRVLAAEAQQELTAEASFPCQVLGNGAQLRRLVSSLVDNAIKFTPAGGRILLRVECQNEQARIIVVDTGIGIAPEHLPRIFDRFYRVDSARSRRTGGNGLGLSICRSIVESHGGSIEVESAMGKGTKVTVTLPGTTSLSPGVPQLESLAAQGV